MKIPTLPYCCCCIDLRIGGLIIGWVGIVSSFLSIAGYAALGDTKIVGAAISLILHVAWLYGIYKVKPAFLLPILVTEVIGLVVLVIVPPILLIVILTSNSIPAEYTNVFGIFALIIYATAAFDAYICVVNYSIYKRIVEIKVEMVNNQNTSPA